MEKTTAVARTMEMTTTVTKTMEMTTTATMTVIVTMVVRPFGLKMLPVSEAELKSGKKNRKLQTK